MSIRADDPLKTGTYQRVSWEGYSHLHERGFEHRVRRRSQVRPLVGGAVQKAESTQSSKLCLYYANNSVSLYITVESRTYPDPPIVFTFEEAPPSSSLLICSFTFEKKDPRVFFPCSASFDPCSASFELHSQYDISGPLRRHSASTLLTIPLTIDPAHL